MIMIENDILWKKAYIYFLHRGIADPPLAGKAQAQLELGLIWNYGET